MNDETYKDTLIEVVLDDRFKLAGFTYKGLLKARKILRKEGYNLETLEK